MVLFIHTVDNGLTDAQRRQISAVLLCVKHSEVVTRPFQLGHCSSLHGQTHFSRHICLSAAHQEPWPGSRQGPSCRPPDPSILPSQTHFAQIARLTFGSSVGVPDLKPSMTPLCLNNRAQTPNPGLWLEFSVTPKICWSPNPSTWECGLIWR